jgi:hypothetical protein
MRRNSHRLGATFFRLILSILLLLGLAGVDPTIVQARPWALIVPPPIARAIAATAAPRCVSFAEGANLRTVLAAPTCPSVLPVSLSYAESDWPTVPMSATDPSLAERPSAVLTQLSPRGDCGGARQGARPLVALTRVALWALLPAPVATTSDRFLLDMPWRPARLAGADRSIARPPPG